MKEWIHKANIPIGDLGKELNAFSKQGCEIYKLWKQCYGSYEIVACREKVS